MLKIHDGQMRVAVNPLNPAGPQDRPYLNRETGKLAFLCKDREADEQWFGGEVAQENVALRKQVSEHPKIWIEIPRMTSESDDFDAHINRFFREHHIDAQLV